MSFSTSFCITNIGSLQLGTSVDFYSDVDSYTTPFQSDILLSNITSPNCPYVLTNIPNGTTTIQILDVNSNCCVEVPVTTFTCDDCNFGFDVYSSVTFNSRIIAGNLYVLLEESLSVLFEVFQGAFNFFDVLTGESIHESIDLLPMILELLNNFITI
jgi:hypothetical protein